MATRRISALDPRTPIVAFKGSFRFLSNFYAVPIHCRFGFVIPPEPPRPPVPATMWHPEKGEVPVQIQWTDTGGYIEFWDQAATVEHAYQAAKATTYQDCTRILKAPTAAAARALGRKLKAIKDDWDAERVPTMRELVRIKFEHAAMRALLLATGDRELVEGNDWGDRFWGMIDLGPGSAAHAKPEWRELAGRFYDGENWLGRILMERRSAIRAGIKHERRGRVR